MCFIMTSELRNILKFSFKADSITYSIHPISREYDREMNMHRGDREARINPLDTDPELSVYS